ncbi:hypothetical protein [Candidatus Karelsulcia muelleri]
MRKLKQKPRRYEPDPKFQEPLVTRFVNHLMKHGKKKLAYRIFYNFIDELEKINKKKKGIKDRKKSRSKYGTKNKRRSK